MLLVFPKLKEGLGTNLWGWVFLQKTLATTWESDTMFRMLLYRSKITLPSYLRVTCDNVGVVKLCECMIYWKLFRAIISSHLMALE